MEAVGEFWVLQYDVGAIVRGLKAVGSPTRNLPKYESYANGSTVFYKQKPGCHSWFTPMKVRVHLEEI